MTGQRQGPRKPATKFAHLRKKMQQNQLNKPPAGPGNSRILGKKPHGQ